jgi:hypothetical protein
VSAFARNGIRLDFPDSGLRLGALPNDAGPIVDKTAFIGGVQMM